MLLEFQQALADLTASPELVVQVRRDERVLDRRYHLTALETRRLLAIASHPGMECACIVYRANRLAPLALNLPETCRTLGPELRRLASDYWTRHPQGNVHFFIETERFCRYLEGLLESGHELPSGLAPVLAREAAAVRAGLRESHTEAA